MISFHELWICVPAANSRRQCESPMPLHSDMLPVRCNSLGNHQRSRIPTMPHLHPFTWDCPSWGMRSIDCALKKNSANIQYLYLFSEVVCLINELEWTNRWQMYLDEYSVSIRLQMITSTRKKKSNLKEKKKREIKYYNNHLLEGLTGRRPD